MPLRSRDDRLQHRLAAVEHVRRREALGDALPRRLAERAPPRRVERERDEPVSERRRILPSAVYRISVADSHCGRNGNTSSSRAMDATPGFSCVDTSSVDSPVVYASWVPSGLHAGAAAENDGRSRRSRPLASMVHRPGAGLGTPSSPDTNVI